MIVLVGDEGREEDSSPKFMLIVDRLARNLTDHVGAVRVVPTFVAILQLAHRNGPAASTRLRGSTRDLPSRRVQSLAPVLATDLDLLPGYGVASNPPQSRRATFLFLRPQLFSAAPQAPKRSFSPYIRSCAKADSGLDLMKGAAHYLVIVWLE